MFSVLMESLILSIRTWAWHPANFSHTSSCLPVLSLLPSLSLCDCYLSPLELDWVISQDVPAPVPLHSRSVDSVIWWREGSQETKQTWQSQDLPAGQPQQALLHVQHGHVQPGGAGGHHGEHLPAPRCRVSATVSTCTGWGGLQNYR